MQETPHTHTKSQTQPQTKTVNSNKRYIIGIISGIVLFIPALIVAHSHQLIGVNAFIFHSINNVALPTSFVTLAKILTEALGAGYAIAACVLIALLFKRFRLAWRFFFVTAGSTVVFYVIKKIVDEPRPLAMLHGNLQQYVTETGPGFPSGHVTAATVLALTLWLILPSKWRWLSALWIIVVGVSRIYLGVHTPVDVIGGFAVGLISVCFVQLLPRRISTPLYLDNDTPLLQSNR